jgi:peptide-methionine (S)-S-oxide reductase
MRASSLIACALLAVAAAPPVAAAPKTETAVLAGGCFWGMEGVFEHVKGVTNVVSGYAGGSAQNANYDAVSSERTGHAEAVKISFDPSQISYAKLLQIYFTVAHDPSEVNRQGPDSGPSYRSAIFPQNAAQAQLARTMIAKVNGAHIYKRPVATKLENGGFYPAEAYHQDFYDRHPDNPYIVANDKPKVASLKVKYPNLFKA